VRRFPVLLLAFGVVIATSGCRNPELEAAIAEEITSLNNTVLELRTYTGELQSAVDSLRTVIEKQDKALRLIVDFTGAAVPDYRGQ
jgi:hypothetical protein